MIEEIVSSGWDVAGCAAKDVAARYEIPVLGLLPETERENGTSDAVLEIRSEMADGTLFFTRDPDEEDVMTLRSCVREMGREWLAVSPDGDGIHTIAQEIKEWIFARGILRLHVAGNLVAKDAAACEDILVSMVSMCLLKTRPDRLATGPVTPQEEILPAFCKVGDVVEDLEARLPLKDRVFMANLSADELLFLDATLGMFILSHYLSPTNPHLLADCAQTSGDPSERMDDTGAVRILIEVLWQRLKKTHTLRIVET